MLELRRLQAFVAVAEEGHITRAADRLGMAQPPLSRLIRGLEAELGTLLFRRLPRGVAMTEAGQALLAEARALLDRAAAIDDIVRRTARGERGQLAVGYTSSAAQHPFVPAVLKAFGSAWPDVRLLLEEASTAELVEALTQGRLDAAFVRTPVKNLSGLVVDPVLDEPMLAAMPADHPLALAGADALPLAALAGEPFILYRRPAGPGLYDSIVAACLAAGFTPNITQEAPRLPSTLSLVAAGLGISIVPASMRRLATMGVSFRPLGKCAGLSAPVHLALRQKGMSATATRFRVMVRQHASHMPQINDAKGQ